VWRRAPQSSMIIYVRRRPRADDGVQFRQNITEFFASQLLLNTSSVTKGNVWNDLWNDISESIKEVMRYE
jgi:hypothetical protein